MNYFPEHSRCTISLLNFSKRDCILTEMKIMNAKKIVMSFLNADEYRTDNEYSHYTLHNQKQWGRFTSIHQCASTVRGGELTQGFHW